MQRTEIRRHILNTVSAIASSFTASEASQSSGHGGGSGNGMALDDEHKAECMATFHNILQVFVDLWKHFKINWRTRRDFGGKQHSPRTWCWRQMFSFLLQKQSKRFWRWRI